MRHPLPLLPLTVVLLALLPMVADLGAGLTLLLRAPLLLWLPGALVLGGMALVGFGPGTRLALETLVGLSINVIALSLLNALGCELGSLVPLLVLTTSALVVVHVVRGTRWRPAGASWDEHDLALVAVASLVALTAGVRGSTIAPETDAGMQLAILERVAEEGGALTRAPFVEGEVSWYYADGWHRLLATAIDRPLPAGGEVLALWHLAAGIGGLLSVLAFGVLARQVLDARWAASSVFLFAVYLRFDALGFPSAIGKSLLMGAIAVAIHGGVRTLPLSALMAAAIAVIHPVESILLAVAAVAVAMATIINVRAIRAGRMWLMHALGTAVVAFPIVMMAAQATYRERALSGDPVDPSFELREVAASVWVVDPHFWGFDPLTPLPLTALLGLLVVMWRGRGVVRAVPASLALAAAVGLLFPPAVWLVMKAGLPTFLLARAGVLFLPALVVGAGLMTLTRLPPGVAVVILMTLTATAPLGRELASPMPRVQASGHPLLSAAGQQLLRTIPPHSIVLTDLWSADFLPVSGGHHPVAGITWHAATAVDQLEARDFFTNDRQSSLAAMDLLRRSRADYLLLTRWEASGLDWPGYGSDFASPTAWILPRANADVFGLAGSTRDLELWQIVEREATTTLVLKDDPGEPPIIDYRAESLAVIGDFDVIGTTRIAERLRVVLRARRDSRTAPLIAALAVPAGFDERSALARVRRRLFGQLPFGYASARPLGTFRIDNRQYLANTVPAGATIEGWLELEVPDGYEIRVGDAALVPRFPLPLGPALDQFARIAPPG